MADRHFSTLLHCDGIEMFSQLSGEGAGHYDPGGVSPERDAAVHSLD
jgi:hypothetical protein